MSLMMLGGTIQPSYSWQWDGDHPSGETWSYYNNGAASKNYTGWDSDRIDSAYGESGNGVQITDVDQYVTYAVSSNDLIDDAIGTIWMSVRKSGTPTNACTIFEAYYDASNYISVRINTSDEFTIKFQNAGSTDFAISTNTIGNSSFERVAYTWDVANDRHQTNVGSSWKLESETLDPFTTDISELSMGEHYSGGGSPCGVNVDIDDIWIVHSWEATDPS